MNKKLKDKKDPTILFKRKNLIKNTSILLASFILFNVLEAKPKKKDNEEIPRIYAHYYLRHYDLERMITLAKAFDDNANTQDVSEPTEYNDDILTSEPIMDDDNAYYILDINDPTLGTTSEKVLEQTDDITDEIQEIEEPTIYNDWGLPITKLVLDESILVSNEEKIAWILEHFNLTMEEFNIIKATCRHEGGPKYFDGFTIINNLYDRTISYDWSPNEEQRNLFYQLTRSGQYNSYLYGYYKQFLDLTPEECPAVQAVIDFLYYKSTGCPVIVHPFLNFSKAPGYQFSMTETNIQFRNPIRTDDYINQNFICISEQELYDISQVGGFANYYLSKLELENPQDENEQATYSIPTLEKGMQRIRRL